MPSPNWMMSSTAAPMLLPRSAASPEPAAATGASCCADVMSSLLTSWWRAGETSSVNLGPGRRAEDTPPAPPFCAPPARPCEAPAERPREAGKSVRSGHDRAAGDVEDVPGNPGGGVGSQERGGAGHILRRAEPLERVVAGHGFLLCGRDPLLVARGHDRLRRDAVRPDSIGAHLGGD